jgi:prophage regulatory protein
LEYLFVLENTSALKLRKLGIAIQIIERYLRHSLDNDGVANKNDYKFGTCGMTLIVSHQNSIPTIGFLRLKQVLALIPISKSKWYTGIKSGHYPAPLKMGRTAVWRAEEIWELIKNPR